MLAPFEEDQRTRAIESRWQSGGAAVRKDAIPIRRITVLPQRARAAPYLEARWSRYPRLRAVPNDQSPAPDTFGTVEGSPDRSAEPPKSYPPYEAILRHSGCADVRPKY